MASADKGNGNVYYFHGMETFEARRLMAVNPQGVPTVLAAAATAVESAAATPDATNEYRYAAVLSTNTLSVVPVTAVGGTAAGQPLTVQIPPNSVVSNTDVAANTAGDRVVVAYELTTTTTVTGPNGTITTVDSNIYSALFVNGAIVGNPVVVNTTFNGNQTDSRVAMDGAGNYVVVWQSTVPGQGLVGKRFNADGTVSGREFVIATNGVEPDVAENAGGTFVVAYSAASGSTTGTFVQPFRTNGVANGEPILVSTETFSEPAVGIANNGRFVVAYAAGNGAARRVLFQRYGNDGTTLGTDINASSNANTAETAPQVGVDTNGGFAIGWAQASSGTNYDAIGFRLFSPGGIQRAPDTVVSGVSFGTDHRFGLAYRIPGTIHIAYSDGTQGLMRTFVDDTAGNGIGDELPVPSGALLIDLSALPGALVQVYQTNSQLRVILNGTVTNYTLSSYTSVYVRGSATGDYVRFSPTVTLPAIVYGRNGRDTITGGSGDDVLDGGGAGFRTDPLSGITYIIGNVINGGAGNDTIYAGDGPSTVFGGSGDDDLTAGFDINVIYGENGNDLINGGDNIDALVGGNGNDTINGGSSDDYIVGGRGDDFLNGDDGNDRIYGQNGNDFIGGGLNNDYLNGGRGDDTILGNTGRDTLLGGANADTMRPGGLTENDPVFINSYQIPTDQQVDIVYYDILDKLSGYALRIQVA